MFILAIITIALIGASQSNHKEEENGKIVTEHCTTQGHEKKCELRYK